MLPEFCLSPLYIVVCLDIEVMCLVVWLQTMILSETSSSQAAYFVQKLHFILTLLLFFFFFLQAAHMNISVQNFCISFPYVSVLFGWRNHVPYCLAGNHDFVWEKLQQSFLLFSFQIFAECMSFLCVFLHEFLLCFALIGCWNCVACCYDKFWDVLVERFWSNWLRLRFAGGNAICDGFLAAEMFVVFSCRRFEMQKSSS